MAGKLETNHSATAGSGVLSMDIRDPYGAFVCQGTYDVTFARL